MKELPWVDIHLLVTLTAENGRLSCFLDSLDLQCGVQWSIGVLFGCIVWVAAYFLTT